MIMIEYSPLKNLPPYMLVCMINRIYVDGIINQTEYDYQESGIEDGIGEFIPTFQRGLKRYVLETKPLPMHRVELFYRLTETARMKIVKDNGMFFNLIPTRINISHDYPFEDKRYAKINMEFDIGEILVKRTCEDKAF